LIWSENVKQKVSEHAHWINNIIVEYIIGHFQKKVFGVIQQHKKHLFVPTSKELGQVNIITFMN
jgi:hypothetical protein